MKITNRSTFILAAVCVLVWTVACQTDKTSMTGNANSAAANTAAPTNTNQPAANSNSAAAKTETAASTTGSLATPTDTYKFGYAARKNKDIAALKRVFSKDALQFLTDVGKEEKKTLDDQLKELADRPQASTDETRNEKIKGDRATLEYLNDKGAWVTMDFAKEGNDWKIDLPKADQ